MKGLIRMVLAALVVAGAVLFVGAGPAAAAVPADDVTTANSASARPCDQEITASCTPAPPGGECKVAPDVESPLDGVTGSILAAPYSATPQGKDPSMWERYGFAGLKWEGYDLGWTPPLTGGCLPNGDSINATMGSQIANMVFAGAKTIVAVSDSLLHSAYNTEWLQVFDPYITEAVNSLRDKVFAGWVPLAFCVLGVVLLFRARSMAFASTASLVGACLLTLVAATFVFTNPLWTAHSYDNTLTGVTSDTSSAINGAAPSTDPASGQSTPDADHALIASVHDALLYQPWVEGEFGNADSPTAKKYAATLFDSQALTWTEAQTVRKGGAAATTLINAKKQKFIDTVDKIKDKDPVAYSFIQGKRANDRITFAFLSLFGALVSMPMVIMASLAMMCAFLIIRLGVVIAPVLAPLAIVRSSVGINLIDRVLSIAATALVWSIGLPVTMLLDRAALTAPGLNPWVRLMLLAIISIASFMTMIGLAPGFGGVINKKYGRKSHKWFGRGLTMAAAWWGAHVGRDDSEAQPRQRPDRPVDGVIEDDVSPYGDIPEEDLYGEVWESGEPIEASGSRALPTAPVTPDGTETAAERDGRTLTAPRASVDVEDDDDDAFLRAAEVRVEDDGTEVHDIYSGTSQEDWERQQASDSDEGTDSWDGRPSIGAGSVGGGEE